MVTIGQWGHVYHLLFRVSHLVMILNVVLVGITITVTVITVAVLNIVAVYFYTHIPVNGAIEGSVTGLSSMFNSAVLLIGGVIAYNVGWHYFRSSFSFEGAVRTAMKQLTQNRPNNYIEARLENMTEEERLAEVVKVAAINKLIPTQ